MGKRRGRKRPRIDPALRPQGGKQPRAAEFEGPSDHLTPAWRFRRTDSDGPWRWRNLPNDEVHSALEKLGHREGLTWKAIQDSGSHEVAIRRLCKEAQRRLTEIKLDDLDQLFSLRLSGRSRVWGIRDHHVLHILWWDPEHQVCPSLKN